jgi:hypothetical protein
MVGRVRIVQKVEEGSVLSINSSVVCPWREDVGDT